MIDSHENVLHFSCHFRFHDTVILGGHGPRTVIQHYGANEYNFRIDDVKSVLDGRDAGLTPINTAIPLLINMP